MLKKIKEWFEASYYPEPEELDSLEKWQAFAEKASYKRVAKVMNRCYVEWSPWIRVEARQKLEVLLQRVTQRPWPKLSKRFYKKHAQRIFIVESLATAKHEVMSNFSGNLPKILMDINRQCLGIVVSRDLVITGFLMKVYHSDIAMRMRDHNMITHDDARKMGKYADYINDLYQLLYSRKDLYNTHYWVACSDNICLWRYPDNIVHMDLSESLARFMIKM